jgi:glycine/D-amino acid oxidase-like deaminating enzyme
MPVDVAPDLGRSWWLHEALADPALAGAPTPPLDTDRTADVVILGGGYTGMWTAYFITEREPSADVVLLESDICGAGASGRNGGFVNSWWSGVDELCERFGDDATRALCLAGSESVAAIGAFCDANGIDAWFTHAGDIGVATNAATDREWEPLVRAAERMGVPDVLRELSPDELRARCDAPSFLGGVLDVDAATVQPARLARGLRNALLAKGVRIFETTPVSRFGTGDPVRAETPGGTVTAASSVVAVNAWAQHWKRFKRAITVRGSYIVVTAPAEDRLDELGWTDGTSMFDYRAALHYVRTTPDGRIAFGIGGMQPDLARHIDPRFAYDEASIRVAIGDLHRMFPSFADVPIDAAWGGPIDVSGDHLPFFGTCDRGTVHYGLGYTGNGVGPCHLGGRILAHRALAKYDDVLALPVVDLEPRRFPPEPIRSAGAAVANRAIHRRDETLDDDQDPNPFVDFVAKLPRRLGYNLGP